MSLEIQSGSQVISLQSENLAIHTVNVPAADWQINATIIYLYKAPGFDVLCVVSVCQAKGASNAAPIVTKLCQQLLPITSSKAIASHLRFEAKIEVQSTIYYTGHK